MDIHEHSINIFLKKGRSRYSTDFHFAAHALYSRCQPPAQCVPSFSNAAIVPLPTVGSTTPIRTLGRCINPCPQECGSSQQDLKCGTDGRTYFNTCYRNCANVPVSIVIYWSEPNRLEHKLIYCPNNLRYSLHVGLLSGLLVKVLDYGSKGSGFQSH